jgi:hypothetical protein
MSSKPFFVQLKEYPHLFLTESLGSGSGCSFCLTQQRFIAVLFHKSLNQSLPAAALAIENGLGILFWTVKWTASLVTLSRLHLKYFCTINARYSTSFSSRTGGIIGLCPNFDWVA